MGRPRKPDLRLVNPPLKKAGPNKCLARLFVYLRYVNTIGFFLFLGKVKTTSPAGTTRGFSFFCISFNSYMFLSLRFNLQVILTSLVKQIQKIMKNLLFTVVLLSTSAACSVKVTNSEQDPVLVRNVGTQPSPPPPIDPPQSATKKVKEYCVIEFPSTGDNMKPEAIARAIENGWQPLGGVCVRPGGAIYGQAMVKYE